MVTVLGISLDDGQGAGRQPVADFDFDLPL
jgi:hypothetical protein